MEFTQAQLHRMTDRNVSVVAYVVIHHTADSSVNKDIAEIAREEIADQNFITVGYHSIIQGSGAVQYGRPAGKVPAANLGMNTVSYAIALEGNFQPGSPGYTGEKPTKAQLSALVALIEGIKPTFPHLHFLIGHNDVSRLTGTPDNATACPGRDLISLLPNLRVRTGLHAA